MNILTKIEVLLSLGELKIFNTRKEAGFFLIRSEISDLEIQKTLREANKAYECGKKLYWYKYSVKAGEAIPILNYSVDFCETIEEFINGLERYNIVTDLQTLIKTK